MRLSIPCIFVLACGSTHPPVAQPLSESVRDVTESAMPAPARTAAGVRLREDSEIPIAEDWDNLNHAGRLAFMGGSTFPYMRDLFQEYDPERYADFGCGTCHGATAAERQYAMPNPDLLALHPGGSEPQRAMVQEHPRMVRFMFNHVVPNMRTMIGEDEFNAESGVGFSCYFCHPHAE